MDTDEKIQRAEVLANELVNIDQNEFAKWIEYLKNTKDLEKTIVLAENLSKSPMLRKRPQRAYQIIHRVINKKKNELRIPLDDLLEILGYTRRILIGRQSQPPRRSEKTGRK